LVNMTVVVAFIHPQRNRFVMGLKLKATG